jgi:hypothetical protein
LRFIALLAASSLLVSSHAPAQDAAQLAPSTSDAGLEQLRSNLDRVLAGELSND